MLVVYELSVFQYRLWVLLVTLINYCTILNRRPKKNVFIINPGYYSELSPLKISVKYVEQDNIHVLPVLTCR